MSFWDRMKEGFDRFISLFGVGKYANLTTITDKPLTVGQKIWNFFSFGRKYEAVEGFDPEDFESDYGDAQYVPGEEEPEEESEELEYESEDELSFDEEPEEIKSVSGPMTAAEKALVEKRGILGKAGELKVTDPFRDVEFIRQVDGIASSNPDGPDEVRSFLFSMDQETLVKLQQSFNPTMNLRKVLGRTLEQQNRMQREGDAPEKNVQPARESVKQNEPRQPGLPG